MKLFIASLIAACGALAGCVAVPVAEPGVYISGSATASERYAYPYAYPYGYRYERPRRHDWRDRDGDGVPNRYDRRPRDPYHY